MRTATFSLVVLSVAACSADSYSPATADHIEVVQGAAQRGTPGTALDSLILARVVDANGTPVPGVEVSWQVVGGGGSVDPVIGEVAADLNGAAWTLGLGFDRQRLLLSAVGVEPVTIEAEARVFTATEFAVGGEFGCGLDDAAVTWCWGLLPDGSGLARIPARVEGAPSFTVLVAGSDHVCGLTAAGEVWCWGMNYFGQLGNGATAPYGTHTPSPLKVPGLPAMGSIDAHYTSTCGVSMTGELWCWGRLGGGDSTRVSATALFAGTVFERIAIGDAFGCGIVAGGQVACWGDNFSGQLGRGTVGGSSSALLPIASSFVATALDAGVEGACAISSDRNVICWGYIVGIRGHDRSATGNRGIPTVSFEDSPAIRLSLGYYCGAIWQSPTAPRLLCSGWPLDIEELPMITGVSIGTVGDICFAIGTGAIYCKTYSHTSYGPPFGFEGTAVPAPEDDAP